MSDTIKCITLQHKDVLESIINTGEYKASYSNVSIPMSRAYMMMSKTYNWTSCPIFLAPVGYNVNMEGAGGFYENDKNIKTSYIDGSPFYKGPPLFDIDDSFVAMEFDIPNEYCRFQDFNRWLEYMDLFATGFDLESYTSLCNRCFEYYHHTFDGFTEYVFNESVYEDKRNDKQVTVEILKKQWLSAYTNHIEPIVRKYVTHEDDDNSNLLKPLKEYILFD